MSKLRRRGGGSAVEGERTQHSEYGVSETGRTMTGGGGGGRGGGAVKGFAFTYRSCFDICQQIYSDIYVTDVFFLNNPHKGVQEGPRGGEVPPVLHVELQPDEWL